MPRMRLLSVLSLTLACLPARAATPSTTRYVVLMADRVAGRDIKISRLAQGVPIGGELDYLDDGTLTAALKARRAL